MSFSIKSTERLMNVHVEEEVDSDNEEVKQQDKKPVQKKGKKPQSSGIRHVSSSVVEDF